MKSIKTTLFAAVVAVCFVSQVQAASVTLDTLLNGGTIQTGDKLLSDFSYSPVGDMPTADKIGVTPMTYLDGSYGVRFNGGFIDVGGGGVSDALLQFTVTVLDPQMEIIGVELYGNPAVSGGDGTAQIVETFAPTNTVDKLEIYDLEPGTYVGGDSVTFASGYQTLVVQKDILLDAEVGSAATLSFFDQVFIQQQVPEPASFGILGVGFVGLLASRRRRNS